MLIKQIVCNHPVARDRLYTKIITASKNRRHEEPWSTKGLSIACKKKNNLYKQFINNKAIINEIRHKMYECNLAGILRSCKRTYYNELL